MSVHKLLPCAKGPHLVEEEVAQAIVNEPILVELDGLRMMGLTAANNHRSSIHQAAKVEPLLERRLILVELPVLQGGHGNINLVLERGELALQMLCLARSGPGPVRRGPGRVRPDWVAADKGEFRPVPVHNDRLARILQVLPATVVEPAFVAIHLQGVQHGLGPIVPHVVPRQLDHIGPHSAQQLNVARIAAEGQ